MASNPRTIVPIVFAALTAMARLSTHSATADDDPPADSKREQNIEIIRDYVSRHRLSADSVPDEFFELRPEPLMFWTNPTRARFFGGIYVWTRNERPLAFCGTYVLMEDEELKVSREFHSLAGESLEARFDGERIWAPEGAGIEFHPAPGAGQPAGTEAARLRQMKAIASQFTLTISKRDTPSERLRVLPRPICRYASPDEGVIDGAMIAFVQGTDPEAMLLVEARSDEGGVDWRYGFARCTAWGVIAQLAGETVYEVPPYYESGAHPITAPFYCLHQRPIE